MNKEFKKNYGKLEAQVKQLKEKREKKEQTKRKKKDTWAEKLAKR